MDDDKKVASYESFREAAEEYGDDRGHDLLTDPDVVAAAKDTADLESETRHGEKLKKIRHERGFTLDELAGKTGIDAGILSQLEAGETYLPLGQLIKLSKALSLKMADFIATGEEPFTIVKSNQRRKFSRFGESREANHGYEYESLAPNKKDRIMEPFIVTLHPSSADEPSSHDGQEFIYVLEGEMEVIVEDFRDVLKPGDAVYYDSTSTHLVRASGDKPAKILAVLTS